MREQWVQDVLSFLALVVFQETERRVVLAEASIEWRVFIPSIVIVVDLMICRGIREMKLRLLSALSQLKARISHRTHD
jgi:hypothetical protein